MEREIVHELNNALNVSRVVDDKGKRGEDPRDDLDELLAAVDRATELARSLHSKPD